jgi:AraC-like DNA-binding protein
LVAELGAEPGPLLRAAGVPIASVGDPEAYLGYRNLITAVESAARVTSAPDFGRRLAGRQGIDILGPVGAAARTAPTVAAALAAISQYLSVYSPALVATLDATDDQRYTRMEFRIALDHLPDHRQTMELSLGVALRIFRLLVGQDFQPVTVHLPHHPLTSAGEYVRYFGGHPRFAEPFAGFTIRSSDLTRPVSTDGSVHDAVRAYLDTVAPPGTPDTAETVRSLIRHLLPTGALQLALVARQLSMHPRTLQRRLAQHSTSFDDLVDEIRRERARRLLRDTDMPMSQLAGALGYTEQSVLTRSCRRWFGRTPTQQRRDVRS